MRFRFPDPVDFPENVEPTYEDGLRFDDLTEHEKAIFRGQMLRVKQAKALYANWPKSRCTPHTFKCDASKLWVVFNKDVRTLWDSKPTGDVKYADRAIVRQDVEALQAVQDALPNDRFKVRDITVQVSRPNDKHHYQQFYDCKTTTRLLNLHCDPKPGVVKAIIYLNEVSQYNGPFQYIPESMRWTYDHLDRQWAWGNSIGNYLNSPEHRRAYNSLPKECRGNAIVGRLIPDDSDMSKILRSMLRSLIGANTGILFDPSYMFHRGGLCEEGERINLQVRLT